MESEVSKSGSIKLRSSQSSHESAASHDEHKQEDSSGRVSADVVTTTTVHVIAPQDDEAGAAVAKMEHKSEIEEEFTSLYARPLKETTAMKPRQRRQLERRRIWNNLCRSLFFHQKRRNGNETNQYKQYRIPTSKEREGRKYIWGAGFYSVEKALVDYTLWHYQASFTHSIAVFFLIYLVLAWLYAFVIRSTVMSHWKELNEQCLHGWEVGSMNEDFSSTFNKAYELSWTTLSTVGFGVVAVPLKSKCRWLRYVLAVEAFVGVLYVGFVGAVIMSKIERRQATARVIFSGAVCLQYGDGLTESQFEVARSAGQTEQVLDADCEEDEGGDDDITDCTSYPVLEIRLVNQRGGEVGGEIADATIRCGATSVVLLKATDGPVNYIDRDDNFPDLSKQFFDGYLQMEQGGEGNDGLGAPRKSVPNVKRTYSQVQLAPDSHPYFNRGAWYVRHTLNDRSPFLRKSIRRAIRSIGGWPAALNDHRLVRKCLSPDVFQFGFMFNGTSNLTASEVFKIQMYTMEDIYVGYQFAEMGYVEEKDGARILKHDLDLVHDIVPQKGGGEEPLGSREKEENILNFITNPTKRRDSHHLLRVLSGTAPEE